MRYLVLFAALIAVSCPRPGVQPVGALEYLQEAAAVYRDDPVHAYRLLTEHVRGPEHSAMRNKLLLELYLDQREYGRAARLLDSVGWKPTVRPADRDRILMRTGRWHDLARQTDSEMFRGIALANLGELDEAIRSLSVAPGLREYRLLELAAIYLRRNDHRGALATLITINAPPDYMFKEYQAILLDALLGLSDLETAWTSLKRLEDPATAEYVKLRIHEKTNAEDDLALTAWNLIHNHPRSRGAYEALRFVTPATKRQDTSYGRVLYYNNQYSRALRHLKRASMDDNVYYYIGRIYYEMNEYDSSLQYLGRSALPIAHYYRGRIHEARGAHARAIGVYDSLYDLHRSSEYAVRGQKRKAFLLEDIGDTLRAAETFLKINERNTKFRAAIQMYKVGDLDRALEILGKSDEPEFIYWRLRTLERLNAPAGNLRDYLPQKFPLSYYALTDHGASVVLDTLPIDLWLSRLGDTLVSFTPEDSLRMNRAAEYFALGENAYGVAELKMIRADNALELIALSRFCARHGEDRQSIRYALEVKEPAAERNVYRLPRELLDLQYPVRYAFSILDHHPDLSLALAMIWQESLFDPVAVSPANARGLMQIIPSTASAIATELGAPGYDFTDPVMSIRFGTYYFNKMMSEFNSIPLALAAYNAGPVRVRRWLKNDPDPDMGLFIELIPYDETRNYVKSILGRQEIYRFLTGGR